MATPGELIRVIGLASKDAIAQQEFHAASVLREVALVAFPARFDDVAIQNLNDEISAQERSVLMPPIRTPTGMEIALAGLQRQPACFKPVAPGEKYPRGEFDLEYTFHPPTNGTDDQDVLFKQDWGRHLVNKYAMTSEVSEFSFPSRTKIAIRRMCDEASDKNRTHYVVLKYEDNPADNARWDQRAENIREDCPSLLFLRCDIQDEERGIAEIELLDHFCKILADSEEPSA